MVIENRPATMGQGTGVVTDVALTPCCRPPTWRYTVIVRGRQRSQCAHDEFEDALRQAGEDGGGEAAPQQEGGAPPRPVHRA